MTSNAFRSARLYYARRRVLDVLRIGRAWAIVGAGLWGGAAGLYVSLAPIPLGAKLVQASFTAAHNGLMGAAIGFAFGVAVALLLMAAKAALRSAP